MKQEKENTVQTLERSTESLVNIAPGEIIIGTLVSVDKQGAPQVDFPGNTTEKPLVAMTTLGITQTHIGRQAALLFANGDIQSPVIMGIIHSPLQDMLENFGQDKTVEPENKKLELESNLKVDDVLIDGKKITFAAHEQIVLRCGESSITLTKAGKILIRGKYLLNRSTGVNRIMGGSVQVN